MEPIFRIREEIRNLIRTNNLQKSVKLLEKAVHLITQDGANQYLNEYLILDSNIHELKVLERTNLNSFNENLQFRNSLKSRILALIDEICLLEAKLD